MKRCIFLIILLAGCSTSAVENADLQASHRLIEWGWDTPRLQEIATVLPRAQVLPFDGLVLDVATPLDGRGLSWQLFSQQSFTAATVQDLTAEYGDLAWGRLTDNFLRLTLYPTDLDLLGDWQITLANLEQWADLTHALGFRGIMFDVEQYGESRLFADPQTGNPDEDYAQLAFRRGEAVMDALEVGYPGLTVMFTYFLTIDLSINAHPERYRLLIPFLEGMLAAADADTTLIDGYEQSYIFNSEAQFRAARDQIETVRLQFSPISRLDHPVQVGFGLWIDPVCGAGGLPPEGCGFTPAAFAAALDYAATYSDRYVWVYSQHLNWYTSEGIPPQWWQLIDTLR